MKIINVVGARPNFMKVAPMHRAFSTQANLVSKIVHTGQHYDEQMSDVFFHQLGLPRPDYFLGIGSGTHAYTTAQIMMAFEKVLLKEKPDLVLVVGDVNSTIACALTASKLQIRVAHVEAGLRSADRTMPEEINRILTDSISDQLFVSEQSGMDNLKKEGIDPSKIHFVGNVMIDSVSHYISEIENKQIIESYNLTEKNYFVATFHRPSNVDEIQSLFKLLQILKEISLIKRVIFPIHPRTKKNMDDHGILDQLKIVENITILPPMGYVEFLSLVRHSAAVVTDSGGIQEETTYMGIPCVTLRNSTERPSTIKLGTNCLVPNLDLNKTIKKLHQIINLPQKHKIPPLWDGSTASRISNILLKKYVS